MKSTIRSRIFLNKSLFKITIIVSLGNFEGGLQNNIFEESHDCSTDEPRNRNRDKPRDEDVPEQSPVH